MEGEIADANYTDHIRSVYRSLDLLWRTSGELANAKRQKEARATALKKEFESYKIKMEQEVI